MSERVKGSLPKAYLRISPDLDQHEDPEAMVLLICAANRQQPRGRFKSRAVVERIVGKKRFVECVRRGDIHQVDAHAWYLDGWDEWQEGDVTVGERMTRLRNRKRRNPAVSPVTPPPSQRDDIKEGGRASLNRNEDTLGRQASGVRRLGVLLSEDTGAARAPHHAGRTAALIAASLSEANG